MNFCFVITSLLINAVKTILYTKTLQHSDYSTRHELSHTLLTGFTSTEFEHAQRKKIVTHVYNMYV